MSTVYDHIHLHENEAGVRRILGVLSLAENGPGVIKDAAKAAPWRLAAKPFGSQASFVKVSVRLVSLPMRSARLKST